MPRRMRSPPQGSPNACGLLETRSEPDLSPATSIPESVNYDVINITTMPRNKRFRGEDVQTDDTQLIYPDGFLELRDMMQSWKGDQDKILNKLVADVSKLRQQNLFIQKSKSEIEKSIKFFNKEYEIMKTRLNTVETEHKEYEKRLNELAGNDSLHKVAILETKIDSMEQQARQSNIEICNVPEKRN